MNGDRRDRYRSSIGAALGVAPDRVTLFAKGRVAFYAILRALDVGAGDEVIVPAFTCVAVPNAILYTGARPIWVDIDPETYTIDPAAVEAAISPRTRVILAQNTFGLSADLSALTEIADRRGLTIVDDCTHGLGGRYHDQPNGTLAPLSFFSTQWSKPISTGLGGFAVDRQGVVAAKLRALEDSAREPSSVEAFALRIMLFGREHVGDGRVFRAGRSAYRRFGRSGLVPASSSHEELEGTAMPEQFLTRLSASQARLGTSRMNHLQADVARRRVIADAYGDWLVRRGRSPAIEPPDQESAFLRYPLRVTDRAPFVAEAERSGIDLGDWFVSPVHPVVTGLDRWGYLDGSAPNAERACREVVNLPTHPSLGDKAVERVIAFLGRNVDLIV